LEKGFEVEGLELSRDMLALGKQRAGRLGLKPVVHEGDMNVWMPRNRYSALLAPAFTLQLSADPAATLRHWSAWLQKGGGLYLTVFMPYAELLGDLPEGMWYEDHTVTLPDGRRGLLETRHRVDRQNRLLHREHRYSISGNPPLTHESRQTIRWIEHQEMKNLLKGAGFRLERYFLDFDPGQSPRDPDATDFDGILTYHATRQDPCSEFS
jgi:hypothetical protein